MNVQPPSRIDSSLCHRAFTLIELLVVLAIFAILIALLIPARTDTKYFHDHLYRRDGIEILYLRGRLRFGNAPASAPFPSMLCLLRGTPDGLSLSHNGRFFIINHGLDAAGVFAGFNS